MPDVELEPGWLARDIDKAANSVGGYVEIRMDTPAMTTLRDAAEMVAADARDETVEDRAHCRISLEAVNALRAALAAEAAWRARAEAAVRLCQAQDANSEAFERWDALIMDDPDDTDWAKVEPARVALEAARDELRTAREGWAAVGGRYEETCRGD